MLLVGSWFGWLEGGSVSDNDSVWRRWSIITQDYQVYCLPGVAVELEVSSGAQQSPEFPLSHQTLHCQLTTMSTMATIPMMEKPCAMCNDKKGLGAPPKPKNQVYSGR